jgi:UDP-glucose 4-epimerase
MAVERAVVTGGAGFIGSSVVESLAGRGTAVLVVDDLSTGSATNLDHVHGDVELLKHDIRDAGPLHEAFTRFRPDAVFHLAARTDVRASMSDPHDDASVNWARSACSRPRRGPASAAW